MKTSFLSLHKKSSPMEVFNLKFVKEVEKHPELYNCTLREYSRKDYTLKAWKEVAKKVHLSVAQCKEKWRNLRSTFVKTLKRPKSTSKGIAKKKPYYLMEAMMFTAPFVKVLDISSSSLSKVHHTTKSPGSTNIPTDNSPRNENTPTSGVPNTSTNDPQGMHRDSAPDISDMIIPEDETLFSEDIFAEISATGQQRPSEASTVRRPTTAGTQAFSELSSARHENKIPFLEHFDAQAHGTQTLFNGKRDISDFQSVSDTDFQAKMGKEANAYVSKDKKETGIYNFLVSLIPDLMQLDDVQLRDYKRKALALIDEVLETSTEYLYRTSENGAISH